MNAYCYRCGGTLDDDGMFCPHCAAPQLRVDLQEIIEAKGAPHLHGRNPQAIDWQSVVRLAIWTAIPVGLMAPFFFPMVLAGPVLLVSLYQRRQRVASVDGKSGFRIGALMGLLAAYVAAFGLAVWQVFDRYLLHHGAAMDAQYVWQVQQSAEATQRMTQATPANAQQAKAMLDFFLSPDGRVTYAFFSTAVMAFGIILLAGLGGILGARLTRRAAAR